MVISYQNYKKGTRKLLTYTETKRADYVLIKLKKSFFLKSELYKSSFYDSPMCQKYLKCPCDINVFKLF